MLLHFLSIQYFTAWLAMHPDLAYGVLACGMFFETLIGTNVFIPGELFLLGGSILAGQGTLSLAFVAPALYLGAAAGDSVNYWIGRRVGHALFKEGRRVFNLKNYHRGEAFFARFGDAAIFLARLIGPFNLVTPFLAGVYQVRYRTFLAYNIAGILVGVSAFIAAGFFFGRHSSVLLFVAHRYIFGVALLLGLGYAAYWYMTRE